MLQALMAPQSTHHYDHLNLPCLFGKHSTCLNKSSALNEVGVFEKMSHGATPGVLLLLLLLYKSTDYSDASLKL